MSLVRREPEASPTSDLRPSVGRRPGGPIEADWRVHSAPDLKPLEALWRQAAASQSSSIFQQFELAAEWARLFAAEGELADYRLRVVYCLDPPLIAPFALRDHELRLLGDGMFDYLDLIGESDAARLESLAGIVARWPDWQTISITGFRDDSPFCRFWQALGAQLVPFSAAPSWEGHLTWAQLDREHPKAAERLKATLKNGTEFVALADSPARHELLDWILRRKAERMAALGMTNVLGRREAHWLERMVVDYPQMCELWGLRKDSQWRAGFLTWRHAGVRYGYTLSFAPEFSRESPGVTLLYAVLRRMAEEGLRFDFLTGEQAFKMRFANGERRLFKLAGRRVGINR